MIGTSVGHYRIDERLGQGGMGEVYLAFDTKLERPVALKFLPQRLSSDPEARQRLLDEAKAASKLAHPSIVTIYGIEQANGQDFIAMEYVRGTTLGHWRGHPVAGELLDILIQLCEALDLAHTRGIVHRDIKPDNLMVDETGRLKVMDFGLASVGGGSHQGLTGAIIGSAPYMSPEQVLGEPIGPESDVFSLGVVLFELATGQTPFSGEYDMAILYGIANEPHPSPSDLNPDIPSGLEDIIDRCLQKEPSKRYQSCAELADELRALVEVEPTTEREPLQATLFVEAASVPAMAQVGLVGRQRECGIIERRLREAREGHGHTLILAGESGVGKTRLAEEAVILARDSGMAVLRGRSLPHDGGFPYHAFTAAFRQGLPALNTALAEALVERGHSVGIELKDRIPVLTAFLNPATEATVLLHREQLWDSLHLFVRTLSAERPILLYLDDIQWADPESAGLFTFLARYAPEIPLLILATMRESEDTESESPLVESVRTLRTEGRAEVISVTRLDATETDSLIAALLPGARVGAETLAAVRGMTAGNPLFVAETVAYLRDTGRINPIEGVWRLTVDDGTTLLPERVREVISRRLERLDDHLRDLLELASCEVEQFDSGTLAACLGRDRVDVLRTLQSLETQHRLLRHEGARYRFDHPTIRSVLYDGLIPELREEYHRLIASHLTERSEARPEDASRIAYHLVSSNQKSAALPHLVVAAERARNLCANSEALNLYSQAATYAETAKPGDTTLSLRIFSGLGDALLAAGRVADAYNRYTQGLALASGPDTGAWRIDLTRRSAVPLRILGKLKEAREVAETALDQAKAVSDPVREIECLNTLAVTHAAQGNYAETIELSGLALNAAREKGHTHAESVALSNIGYAAFHIGNYREAVEHLDRAITLQRSLGDRRGMAQSLNFAGLSYHRLGRYVASLRSHSESLETKRSIEETAAVPGSLNGLGDLYRDMGLLDRAIECHTESLALARQQGNKGAECDNLRDLGADFLLTGDHESARRYLTEAQSRANQSGYMWYELRSLITLAWLDSLTGDHRSADERSQDGLSKTRAAGAREPMVEAHWVRGKVLLNAADHAAGIAELKTAIHLAEDADLGSVLWQMQWDLHQAQSAAGDRQGAETTLREARKRVAGIVAEIDDPELKEAFGATPIIRQILGH